MNLESPLISFRMSRYPWRRRRTKPRFTVLLPTHNRADVLGHAIGSVLRQTETDFELLVVADGCTDDTAVVAARFDDPRLRFFDLPKAPASGYANRALVMRQATGRLVAYAAHDDLMFSDHLEKLGALLDNGSDWTYSRPIWVSTDGTAVPFMTDLRLADERAMFFKSHNTVPSNCVAHTRSLYDAVGGWPEDSADPADWTLWRQMLDQPAARLAVLTTPTGLHFSANWKNSRRSGSEEMRKLLELADAAPWWPGAMRMPPEPGQPEQVRYARAIANDRAWCRAFREAADIVVARLAWDRALDLPLLRSRGVF